MILICGIPNSGKTTYSSRYENVIHYDEVRGGRRRVQTVIDLVHDGSDVCVEGVYGRARHRSDLVAASQDDSNTCIWLDTPLDTCIHREETGRQRSTNMVIWAHNDFEPPTYEEGWNDIIVIRPESKEHKDGY